MMAWGMRVLGQHWANHLALCFLNTYGSSCLTSDAPKCSLMGTCPVFLLELDRWAMMRDSMWRHLTPHDAPRPWQRRAIVGRNGYDGGQQQVMLTLCGGAWHWWLSCWFLVCVGLVAWMQGRVGLLWWLNDVCKALGQ